MSIGQFCRRPQISDDDVEREEVVAMFDHKLRYQLNNWDGTELTFRLKPFRVSMSHLYERQTELTTTKEVLEEIKITTEIDQGNLNENVTNLSAYQEIGKVLIFSENVFTSYAYLVFIFISSQSFMFLCIVITKIIYY